MTEFLIEGEAVVTVSVIVKANSPEDALNKAQELQNEEWDYDSDGNPYNLSVQEL